MKLSKHLAESIELDFVDFPDGILAEKISYTLRVKNHENKLVTFNIHSISDDLWYTLEVAPLSKVDYGFEIDLGKSLPDTVITFVAFKNGEVLDYKSKRINCLKTKSISPGPIVLRNNLSAVNLWHKDLISFLKEYDHKNKWNYINRNFPWDSYGGPCVTHASCLHDYSESAGVRAAIVVVYSVSNFDGHALNAFETIDNGLIFIDSGRYGSFLANVKQNEEYKLLDLNRYSSKARANVGVIKSIEITW